MAGSLLDEDAPKRIVTACAHCYNALLNDYPQLGGRYQVVHHTQLLDELVQAGRIPPLDLGAGTTYHDPCYLGRHNGIYDEPREVLGMVPGLELAELPESRVDSLCCGGGGGRIWMETPKEERFANLRVQQARDAGAEVLVTACPYCISNFEESRLTLGLDEALEVKDLTELIQEAM